jgi:hypothetical protein
MKKILVFVAGCIMILFAVLHGYLGWKIHGLSVLSPDHRALMEMLNVATGLFALFFGVASLFLLDELLATRLGSVVLSFGLAMMAFRAMAEIIIAPSFNVPIFVVCAIVACFYGLALVPGASPDLRRI